MSDLKAKMLRKLINERPEGTKYDDCAVHSHLLDQYKLYVEMVDRVSGRRLTANTYFLSVNTALLGYVAYIAKDSTAYLWLLGSAGVALCWLWFRIIRSYRGLNTAKFAVIHEIEKLLPLSPYAAEWEFAGKGKNSDKYHPLTHIETGVPIIFLVLHAFVILRTIPWNSWGQWICS